MNESNFLGSPEMDRLSKDIDVQLAEYNEGLEQAENRNVEVYEIIAQEIIQDFQRYIKLNANGNNYQVLLRLFDFLNSHPDILEQAKDIILNERFNYILGLSRDNGYATLQGLVSVVKLFGGTPVAEVTPQSTPAEVDETSFSTEEVYSEVSVVEKSLDINSLDKTLESMKINISKDNIPKKAPPTSWLNNKNFDDVLDEDNFELSNLKQIGMARSLIFILSLMHGSATETTISILANRIKLSGGLHQLKDIIDNFRDAYLSKWNEEQTNTTTIHSQLNAEVLKKLELYLIEYMTSKDNIEKFGHLFGLFENLPYNSEEDQLNTLKLIEVSKKMISSNPNGVNIMGPNFYNEL